MEEDNSGNKLPENKIVKFEELKRNYEKKKKKEHFKNMKRQNVRKKKTLKLEEEVKNYNRIRNMKVSEVIAMICNIEKYMEGNY